MRSNWLFCVMIVFLTLLMLIVGCSSSPSPLSTTTAVPPPSTTSTVSVITADYGPAWDKIVAAAKAEGELTGYGVEFVDARGKAIIDSFGAKYGIKVNGASGLSSQLLEKIKTETATGKVVCDIASFTMPVQSSANQDGLLQEFVSKLPEYQTTKASGWKADPTRLNGSVVFAQGTVFGPFINTDLVKGNDIPKSWNDLLDPKWDGKLILDSPTLQGVCYRLYQALPKMGINPDEYFTKLGKNNPAVKAGIYDVVSAVAKGDYSIAVMGYYQYVSQNRPSGVPVQIASVNESWIFTEGSVFSMVKNCPHPNAALVFLNWYLTTEGVKTVTEAAKQTMVIKAGMPDYWDMDGLTDGISKLIYFTPEDYQQIVANQTTGKLEQLMGLPVLK